MEKLQIKLEEVLKLEGELNGVTQKNNATGETKILSKGLLNEKLSLSTKYHLLELTNQITEIKKTVDSLYEELLKKHGEKDEESGNISIPFFIKGTEEKDAEGNIIGGEENPSFKEFQTEYNSLLQEVKEINYTPISIATIEKIETEEVYDFVLQNLIEKN